MQHESDRRDDGTQRLSTTTPTRSPQTRETTTAYERPVILSHSGEDILEELGPAQACYPFNSCGISP